MGSSGGGCACDCELLPLSCAQVSPVLAQCHGRVLMVMQLDGVGPTPLWCAHGIVPFAFLGRATAGAPFW